MPSYYLMLRSRESGVSKHGGWVSDSEIWYYFRVAVYWRARQPVRLAMIAP